jgi:hypothetical protein
MVATHRQIEANCRNAQRSTGPRTDEGKTVSRGNALKHGLAGDGVVLPDDETAKVNERMAYWADMIGPVSPLECYVVEQIATESIRIDRAQRDERILLHRRATWAESGWDEDRRLAAEELGTRLAKDPARTVRRLRQTSQGCDWLIERWQGLTLSLQAGHAWDADQTTLALDLLGFPHELRGGPTPADPAPGAGASATAPQAALVAEQIARLEQLKVDVMDSRDAIEREAATHGVTPGDAATERELALTRRYEAACQRWFDRSVRLLLSGDLNGSSVYKPAKQAVAAAQARAAERAPAPPEREPEPEFEPEPEPDSPWAQVVAEPRPMTTATSTALTFPGPAADLPRGNRRWRKEQDRRAREHAR